MNPFASNDDVGIVDAVNLQAKAQVDPCEKLFAYSDISSI